MIKTQVSSDYLESLDSFHMLNKHQKKHVYTHDGKQIICLNNNQYQFNLENLINLGYLIPLQLYEMGAFALSVIVRSTLSSSYENCNLLFYVARSLAGAVTLCCARQLVNAGAKSRIIILKDTDKEHTLIPDRALWNNLIESLQKRNVEIFNINDDNKKKLNVNYEKEFQQVIIGNMFSGSSLEADRIKSINDSPITVHQVQGFEKNHSSTENIFSSSTLSLGLPLDCLFDNKHSNGRMYLCDVGLDYSEIEGIKNLNFSKNIFANQPIETCFFEQPKSPH